MTTFPEFPDFYSKSHVFPRPFVLKDLICELRNVE